MTQSLLQKNLTALLKEKNYEVGELERLAGLKRNSIYNILKGFSKKPSAETLSKAAEVLGVTVKDLLSNKTEITKYLTSKDLDLIKNIYDSVSEVIELESLNMTYNDLSSVIREIFDFSITSNINEADLNETYKKFVRWAVLNRIKNNF